MKIEIYIAQLLYRYQCVTVPGFGAFLSEIQSAQLVDNSHSFFPPKKMISFNIHLKNNDGLLANHIAQAENTSYDYTVSAIEYAVLEWKKELQGSTRTMKSIGLPSWSAAITSMSVMTHRGPIGPGLSHWKAGQRHWTGN